jgi:hypothetical protein
MTNMGGHRSMHLTAHKIRIAAVSLDEQLTKISAELPVLPIMVADVSKRISEKRKNIPSRVSRGQQRDTVQHEVAT